MNVGACLQAILGGTRPKNRLQAGSYNPEQTDPAPDWSLSRFALLD
jgi:hypothetical protein